MHHSMPVNVMDMYGGIFLSPTFKINYVNDTCIQHEIHVMYLYGGKIS